MYLVKCNTCGKIYKVTREMNTIDKINPKFPKYDHYFETDLGGKMNIHYNNMKCMNCNEYTPYEIMKTEDWVADLVFKIKGK